MSTEWLEVGRVTRPHGLRGHLVVRPLARGSSLLAEVPTVAVGAPGALEPRRVLEARVSPQSVTILVEGVVDRTAAEQFVGASVWVHRNDRPPLAEDEFYGDELIGLPVFTPDGTPIGRVLRLESSPPLDWIVVEHEGVENLVPVQAPLVRFDRAGRRVVLDAPEGLLGPDGVR